MSDSGMADPNWVKKFASTDEEADARYQIYKSKDPFPGVAPSLLNSADLSDYVSATGMIIPFDEERRKTASYGVPLLGRCIYWDEDGRQDFVLSNEPDSRYPDLEARSSFVLRRNSIAFVTLEPYLRLPDYIAARFNLTIRDVYRGLLLGTGPIVDPGFQGYLSIPLHNLTNNDYEYSCRENDELVWMEVTKLTLSDDWLPDESGLAVKRDRQGEYSPFPDYKLGRKDVNDYLVHALEFQRLDDVQSSIPIEVNKAVGIAEKSELEIKYFRRISWFGIAAFVVTILISIWGGFSLFTDTVAVVDDAREELQSSEGDIRELRSEIRKLEGQVSELTSAGREEQRNQQRLMERRMGLIEEALRKLESVQETKMPPQ